jgi:hypothetical protein
MPKANYVTWVIFALDRSSNPDDAFLFTCSVLEGNSPRGTLQEAWREWAKTEEGKEYIEQNGTNWGDCLHIPREFLKAAGIGHYDNAVESYPGTGGRLFDVGIRIPHFDRKLVVEHVESLLPR